MHDRRMCSLVRGVVDKYGQTAAQYGIQGVPTLMLFHKGEILWRQSGLMARADLLAAVNPFLR